MGIQINGQTDTISAVDGSITVATDLTVPGALTYDDVTNIDSVGVVTARSGLQVTGGNVGIDQSNPTNKLEVEGSASVARFVGNRTDALGPRLSLAKSRGSTSGSATIVQDGDEIGQIMFKGADGTDADSTGAAIIARVNGTPGVNDMPGALTFLTTNDGTNSPTERLRITKDGDFYMHGNAPTHTTSSGSIFLSPPSGNPSRGILWSNTSDTHYVKLEPSVIDGLVINGYSGVAFATGSRSNSTWAEKVRITSSGDLFVAGTGGMNTTQLPNGSTINVNGTSSNDGLSVIRYSTGYGAYGLNIGRSKSDTIGTNAAVTNGNDLGHISFYGADGTDFNMAAMITAQVDGTPSDGTDMPGRLVFKTSSDGSATPTERLRITSGGTVDVTGKLRIDISNGGTAGSGTAEGIFLRNTQETDNNAVTIFGGADDYNTAASAINFINVDHSANAGDISFDTRSTSNSYAERLRILSDGTITTGGLSSTPGTVAAGSFVQAAANAGFFSNGIDGKFGTASSHPLYLQVNGVSKSTINTAGNMGVGNADPTQARLVAQTASGMSIAAVKDNTGASISLGGVTQPRVLFEAGASASQFKLYTASGSSYSSPNWRQRLLLTPTNASVSSTGNGANGLGCFGIADNSPDSRALALSIGGGSGAYGLEDPRPLVYLQRSYGIGGGSSTDETTLEVNAPGSYNSAGVVYGIKSRAQHNLNGSHYAGHFEAHGSQYSANGTSALYAKTTKLDTNGPGDVIAFRADASVLQVGSSSGSAIAGYFATGNNANTKPLIVQNGYTTNSYSNQIIFRKHNGSGIVDVGSIKSNNTATQYNTSSDYRLKENIVSLTGAIDRLKQLQPKRFNFIGIDETIDGFIAHEVNPVAPYAVSGEKDAVKKELVLDEDGKEQFDENGEIIHREVIDPQGVDYSKLTTLAIAALQEAITKIETLETQLTDALARITALEG